MYRDKVDEEFTFPVGDKVLPSYSDDFLTLNICARLKSIEKVKFRVVIHTLANSVALFLSHSIPINKVCICLHVKCIHISQNTCLAENLH